MNDDRSEIDLIEYFYSSKKNSLASSYQWCWLLFAVLFLWINKNEVTVNYSIKIKKKAQVCLLIAVIGIVIISRAERTSLNQ
jgi:hypothetical protein